MAQPRAEREFRTSKERSAMTVTGLFGSLRKTRLAAARRIVVTSLIVLVSTFEICGLAGLRINGSASLPVGLYLVTQHPNGNLVAFCPPEPFAQLAIER